MAVHVHVAATGTTEIVEEGVEATEEEVEGAAAGADHARTLDRGHAGAASVRHLRREVPQLGRQGRRMRIRRR